MLLREVPIHDGNPSVLFVEVKGENDRLSEKQLDWIEFFQQNSFNFELCKVSKLYRVLMNRLVKRKKLVLLNYQEDYL